MCHKISPLWLGFTKVQSWLETVQTVSYFLTFKQGVITYLNFFVEGKRLGVGGFSLLGVGGFVVFDNPLIFLAGVEGFSEVTGLFTPGVANNKLCLLLRGVVEDGRGGRAITLLPIKNTTVHKD